MVCKKCGNEIPSHAKFCKQCGAPILSEKNLGKAQNSDPKTVQTPRQKTTLWTWPLRLIAILSIAVIAVSAVTVAVVLLSDRGDKAQPSSSKAETEKSSSPDLESVVEPILQSSAPSVSEPPTSSLDQTVAEPMSYLLGSRDSGLYVSLTLTSDTTGEFVDKVNVDMEFSKDALGYVTFNVAKYEVGKIKEKADDIHDEKAKMTFSSDKESARATVDFRELTTADAGKRVGFISDTLSISTTDGKFVLTDVEKQLKDIGFVKQ